MHYLNSAEAVADAVADRLAAPSTTRGRDLAKGWWPQSLARGAAGVALLHIERARAGLASWQPAHDWLTCATDGEVSAGANSGLYYGAPALAFALHTAADRPGRYARALDNLDRHIAATTRYRLHRAHARIDHGRLPALAEFDAIRGLSGVGAYLLRRESHADLTRAVLSYLVRLTEPILHGGQPLPGWWTDLDPAGRPSPRFPGGHANHGMAHGIAGPLALMSLALRRGVAVDGQTEAIGRICRWLDRWRQHSETGPWWPYWVTRADLRADRLLDPAGPARPSWCYGTVGLARAQQLAALATGDAARRRAAEEAMTRALTDPWQLAATADLCLCHGYAGLLHIAGRAARDAVGSGLAGCLPRLFGALVPDRSDADRLAGSVLDSLVTDPGLLEGAAGVALALHTAATGALPISGWDSCLLIN